MGNLVKNPARRPGKYSNNHTFNFDPEKLMIGVEFEGGWTGGWRVGYNVAADHPELDMFPESDGSMGINEADALEIVVHPVEHKEVVSTTGAWKAFLDDATANGFYSGQTTGMHINVNCPEAGQRHRACWMLNRFADLGMVFGRRGASYNPFIRGTQYDYAGRKGSRFQKGHAAADRENRVEVRLHRSTSKFEDFKASINYSAAVVEYAAGRAQAPTQLDFVLWCMTKPEYFEMLQYAAANLLAPEASERADYEKAKRNVTKLFSEVGLID